MKNRLLFSVLAGMLLSSAQAQERSAYQIAQEAAQQR